MSSTFSELERVHLLIRLKKLVELKYAEEPSDDISNIDTRIKELLNNINMLEYYIW